MKLVKLLLFVIVALAIGNITLSNQNLDVSVALSTTSIDIVALEKEASMLRVQVADMGSLTKLETAILAEGYIEASQVVTLNTDSPAVAILQSVE